MRITRPRIPDGTILVVIVIVSAVLFVGLIGWRAYQNVSTQNGLCEKIDRFIVASEAAVRVNDTLTPAEKAARIRFFEDFRNDPPVCRTN